MHLCYVWKRWSHAWQRAKRRYGVAGWRRTLARSHTYRSRTVEGIRQLRGFLELKESKCFKLSSTLQRSFRCLLIWLSIISPFGQRSSDCGISANLSRFNFREEYYCQKRQFYFGPVSPRKSLFILWAVMLFALAPRKMPSSGWKSHQWQLDSKEAGCEVNILFVEMRLVRKVAVVLLLSALGLGQGFNLTMRFKFIQ